MKTRTLATFAAIAGLTFSSVSSAAWYAKFDGVDGKAEKTTEAQKKPKEVVVLGVKPAGWDPKKKSPVAPKR